MEPARNEKDQFDERLYRDFPQFTNGEDPWLDRLYIICTVIEEMDGQNELHAALGWINGKYGPD